MGSFFIFSESKRLSIRILHLDEVINAKGGSKDEDKCHHPVAHVLRVVLGRRFHVECELGEEEEDLEADANQQLDAKEGEVGLRGERGLRSIGNGLE